MQASFSRKGIDVYFRDKYGNNNIYTLHNNELGRFLYSIRGSYTDTNLIELFHSVPEIYAPIDIIARGVSSGIYQLKRVKTDEVVYDNKDINRLLSSPNPFQTFEQFIYESECYRLVTGKEFININIPDTLSYNYKNVSSIWNLPSDKIEVKTKQQIKLYSSTKIDDVIIQYELQYGNSKQVFTTDKVLYTHTTNLNWDGKKIISGASPLLSAERAICNLIAVYEARNVIYVKRGALGVIVSKKSDASGNIALLPSEKKAIREDLDKDYGITGNRFPYSITDQPVDFIRFGMSIQELQPFEETQSDASAIYAVLNVPRDLMPKQEGATFENQKQAEKRVYQNVIIPAAKNKCQSLTNFLKLNDFGYYLDVSFDHIEILQEDKKFKSEVFKNNASSYVQLYEKNLITKNQLLVSLGMEEVDSGDVFINDESNNVPLAVKLGVSGIQALQSILSDYNLTEDSKRNTIIVLFGVTEEQARMMVSAPINTPKQNEDA